MKGSGKREGWKETALGCVLSQSRMGSGYLHTVSLVPRSNMSPPKLQILAEPDRNSLSGSVLTEDWQVTVLDLRWELNQRKRATHPAAVTIAVITQISCSTIPCFLPLSRQKQEKLRSWCIAKKIFYGQQKREKRNKPRLKYNIQCKRIGEKRREGI